MAVYYRKPSELRKLEMVREIVFFFLGGLLEKDVTSRNKAIIM